MPTYTVSTSANALTATDRQTIATAITRIHHAVTGAQTFFAQVLFIEVAAGSWFVGGAPVGPNTVFVHGQIRGGRATEMKRELLTGLLEATATAARVPRTSVWVYLVVLPAADMAEYGHILPEPGAEAQWLAGLPPADRALVQSTGAR